MTTESQVLGQHSILQLVSTSFLGRVLGRLFTYGMYLYVGRFLGPKILGAFTAGLIILQFGGAVSQVGTRATVQKYIPIHRNQDQKDRLTGVLVFSLSASILVGTAIAAAIYAASGLFESYISEDILTATKILVLGIPLWAFHSVGESATLAFKRTKYSVYIRDFARSGSAMLFVGITGVISPNLIGLSIAYLSALVVASVATIIILLQLNGFSKIRSPSLDIRDVSQYSLSVLPQSISGPVMRWGDILVLTLFVASVQIGWYQSAFQTAILLVFAVVSINSVYPPLASDLYTRGDLDKLHKFTVIATKWAIILTLFAASYAIVFRKSILGLFGPSYIAAEYVLIVLVIGRTMKAMTGPVGFLLSMTDNERLELWNGIGGAVINIILNFALVPQYGLMGAAVATTVSLGLVNIARLLQVRQQLGFWTYSVEQLSSLIPLGIATGAMLIVQTTISGSPIITLITGGVISFGLFLIILILVSVDDNDRMVLQSIEDI